MIRYLAAYGAVALVFLVLDGLWLTLAANRLYRSAIGEIMADQIRLAPAIAFYLLYVAGIVGLAVRPAGSWLEALVLGAFLGLVAYGTYALTDQAILKVWATRLTLADMSWGALATAIAAAAGYYAFRRFS